MPSPFAEDLERRPNVEAVSVYVKDAEVTVVVRDSNLSDELALRTALEVSRRIAGRDGALRRLLLNGRTLHDVAGEGCAPPVMPGTLFSC